VAALGVVALYVAASGAVGASAPKMAAGQQAVWRLQTGNVVLKLEQAPVQPGQPQQEAAPAHHYQQQQQQDFAHSPPGCAPGAAPPRQLVGQRDLLVAPQPLADLATVIADAAAANDTRLERVARMLTRHRAAAAAASPAGATSVAAEARAAYAVALREAALDAAHRSDALLARAREQGGAAAAAAEAPRPRPAPPPAGTPSGAPSSVAASMIAEALLAVKDAAAVKGGEPVVVPCMASADPTQPTTLPPGQRMLIAANLRSSEAVAPNFMIQVLTLALSQQGLQGVGGGGGNSSSSSSRNIRSSGARSSGSAGGDPQGGRSRVFVAVYESGSQAGDKTGAAGRRDPPPVQRAQLTHGNWSTAPRAWQDVRHVVACEPIWE
jgi:hypothetical protein